MTKVLLIQPVLSSIRAIGEIFEKRNFINFDLKRINFPLGLLHIGSLLDENSINTKIIDLDRDLFYYVHDEGVEDKSLTNFLKEYLVDATALYQPDVIGISGNFNCNATFVERCCEDIKRFNKDIPIVLGGHYPTNCYKEILTDDLNVDYVILGEGEEIMQDLVNAIVMDNESLLDNNPGIVTRNNVLNNSISSKGPAMIGDLESLPPVNYSILDNIEDYLTSKQDMRTIIPRENPDRTVAMMTSRGCSHQCTYCASYKVHGKKLRAFSVDRVVDEISDLVGKYDINTIIFEDDLFTYSRKRTIELSRKIYESFGNRFFLEFPNGIAVRTLNDEVVYWLAKAGMKQINLAIETGNQYVQDVIIKKKLKLELVKPVVDILKKYDVLVRAYFIVGFPGETIEMMEDTKDFAKKLKLDWAVFSFATPIVGSELYETARINNQLVNDNLDTSTYFDAQLRSDDWSQDDVARIQEEANYEVNFLENYNLVDGKYEKGRLIFEDILHSYPKHLFGNYCLWRSQIGLGDYTGAEETERTLQEIIETNSSNMALLKKYNLLNEEPFVKFLTSLSDK